ncbi:MAG: hypothetical protein KatS3mg087_1883 [Patescibacteria group bacterium]|nr:MAG: hypothetical protein KatS3mg087_1883 [Patescibacteria group bacterium]
MIETVLQNNKHLISSTALVKNQDIVADETDIIAGNLPLIAYNIDRIDVATTYFASHTVYWNVRVSFYRGTYDSMMTDSMDEVAKVANLAYKLSTESFDVSQIDVVKRETDMVVTYIFTASKSVKANVC